MYIFRSIHILVVTITLLSACASGTGPRDVATDYLNAMNKMDYETAKKFCTPEKITTIKLIQSTFDITTLPDSTLQLAKRAKVEIKEVKEEGDRCIIKYVVPQLANIDQELLLIKKDNKWLVAETAEGFQEVFDMPAADTSSSPVYNEEEAVPQSDSAMKLEMK